MIKGRVIGEVWATKKAPSLRGHQLKLVEVLDAEGPTPRGRIVVATDTLDASRGQAVMVSFGSGARNVLSPGAGENRFLICDSAISQVIDAEVLPRSELSVPAADQQGRTRYFTEAPESLEE